MEFNFQFFPVNFEIIYEMKHHIKITMYNCKIRT